MKNQNFKLPIMHKKDVVRSVAVNDHSFLIIFVETSFSSLINTQAFDFCFSLCTSSLKNACLTFISIFHASRIGDLFFFYYLHELHVLQH